MQSCPKKIKLFRSREVLRFFLKLKPENNKEAIESLIDSDLIDTMIDWDELILNDKTYREVEQE